MGIFKRQEPLKAATVRTYDRIPERPKTTATDTDLWHIYRCVPEVHYATNQQARLVGRLRWRIEIDGKEVKDSEDILRRAFGNDLRSVTVAGAIHLQVTGQFYLVRVGTDWKVLGAPLNQQNKKLADAATLIVHVMIEDPAISTRADSPVMSIRDIATELILARAQARVSYRHRTAQTKTIVYPREGAGPNPEKFERDWQQAEIEPVVDEKSASVAGIKIGFANEYIPNIKVIDSTAAPDEKLHERIDRLIRQMAIGLDITPSLMLGMEDSTHWTAWATQEDNWLGHVEPMAAPIGQVLAEALAKATDQDADRIEVIPDPAPLLRRRPAISDVLAAWEKGLVDDEWAREQLGAPESAAGTGIPEPTEETITVDREATEEPSIEESETRQISTQGRTPTAAASTPTIDGARLADIDDQAYTSLTDLVTDVSERVLEKLGAKVRSLAQRRSLDLPADVSNVELGRLYTGEIPNAESTVEQTARDAEAKVLRVIQRAQGRLRAMGIDVEDNPDDPRLTAAQSMFVAAVIATVAAIRSGGTGEAEAWQAGRQIATVAGGGAPSDFRQAASGIALAASTMQTIRRDLGLAPPTGPESYRWLHLYQGPHPHPVHLSLKDAEFDGQAVFAAGYEAYPGDHPGCQCIAAPAEFTTVRTGWSGNQPGGTTDE